MEGHIEKRARDAAGTIAEAVPKEWHSPVLKKLAIAATAGGNMLGNEGQGGGKGAAGTGLNS